MGYRNFKKDEEGMSLILPVVKRLLRGEVHESEVESSLRGIRWQIAKYDLWKWFERGRERWIAEYGPNSPIAERIRAIQTK